ncbi:hypothetical protein ACWDRB_07690 [Nonomuraea sp. NPDC003707]
MTRPARSALVALAMTLLAIMLLSHGVPSADDPYAPATAVAAGETSHCDHFPTSEEKFGHAWALDRQRAGRPLDATSPSDAMVPEPAAPALTTVAQAEDPPYGPRRQPSGALLQVFRC